MAESGHFPDGYVIEFSSGVPHVTGGMIALVDLLGRAFHQLLQNYPQFGQGKRVQFALFKIIV